MGLLSPEMTGGYRSYHFQEDRAAVPDIDTGLIADMSAPTRVEGSAGPSVHRVR
jgi:hypothetical protein